MIPVISSFNNISYLWSTLSDNLKEVSQSAKYLSVFINLEVMKCRPFSVTLDLSLKIHKIKIIRIHSDYPCISTSILMSPYLINSWSSPSTKSFKYLSLYLQKIHEKPLGLPSPLQDHFLKMVTESMNEALNSLRPQTYPFSECKLATINVLKGL